jgi:hypothetical protein
MLSSSIHSTAAAPAVVAVFGSEPPIPRRKLLLGFAVLGHHGPCLHPAAAAASSFPSLPSLVLQLIISCCIYLHPAASLFREISPLIAPHPRQFLQLPSLPVLCCAYVM